MTALLYWPAERRDHLETMRTAAAAAAPFDVGMVESLDELDLSNARAFAVSDAHMDDAMIDRVRQAPRLEFVQLLSSGSERTAAASFHRELAISNAPGIWAPSVAEHAIALLFGLTRQLHYTMHLQRERDWRPDLVRPRLHGLEGMTVAILGCGAIGRAIGLRLAPFGVTRIGVSRTGAGTPGESFDELASVDSLIEVLERVEALFLSVPLSKATHRLIGGPELRALGPGGLLVNTARGPVVDSQALVEALENDRIAGAAIDVADPEPLPSHSPLWAVKNLIIAPHVGSHPSNARTAGRRLGALLKGNLERLYRGDSPDNLIR
jgi:phosphoglycerate dehydrogenase-like enzyme